MVGEVVPVFPLQVRSRGALGRDESDRLPVDRVREEGEREAAEVRPAAEAGDHDVRIRADLLELSLGLETDDRLVQEYMVQDGSEAIDRLLVPFCVLEAFGHRDAEGARMIRLLRQKGA